jgi:hypothetical protein
MRAIVAIRWPALGEVNVTSDRKRGSDAALTAAVDAAELPTGRRPSAKKRTLG